MGRCDDRKYEKFLQGIYPDTHYLGYIPAPQHLAITALCQIGIANYDYSDLNTVFCAPNKTYEYAKFGKPMLVSKNPGLVETVGIYRAAECVDFSNSDEVSKAISRIMNKYDDYVEASQKFYRDTDYKDLVDKVLDKVRT